MKNPNELDHQIIEYPSNRLLNISGTGELSVSGNLNLSGSFSGKLNVSQCLVVGKEGVIMGEFKVKDLKLYGKVIGTIHVSGRAELYETSHISGKIFAKEIKMHSGSSLNGEPKAEKPLLQENENNGRESVMVESFFTRPVVKTNSH